MSSFPPPESNPPEAPAPPPAYELQPPAFQPDAAAQQAAQAADAAAQQAAQQAAYQPAQPPQPRYGELAPPQYGERIPQYGAPAAPQPYPAAAQQPFQQPYQPPYPVAPGYSPFDLYPPEAPKSPRLGQVAMYAAIGVFVLSVIASIVVGTAAGPLSTRTSTSFNFNSNDLSPEQAAGFAGVGSLILVQMLLGTAIGVWAFVQGIVAAVTKRGRSFGVVAIIVAAAAPIVSVIAYMVAIVATLPPL
ncbi:hypothetical protein [Leifsonia sp. NPDC058248]|uniref:hypothetical protein n=1 Tax=Leifsonia sp. NPDC058248 TaxID=3346402 RepID=UPI0036DED4C6